MSTALGELLCEACIRTLPDSERRMYQILMVQDRQLRALIQHCVEREPKARPSLIAKDKFLVKNGSKRTHMSCNAAILLLFASTSTRQHKVTTNARKLQRNHINLLVNVVPLHQVTGVITSNPDTPQAAPITFLHLPTPTAPVLNPAIPCAS
ncbi:uncharacterized protein LOC144652318 [Oculina patagonica]